MNIIETILALAKSLVGTTEHPADSNKTIFGVEYGWNGVAWCVIFVWYLFHMTGNDNLFYDGKKTASSGALVTWGKKKGYIVSEPKRGDIVVFSFRKNKDGSRETSHTGIIESVQANTIKTYEGNTSSDAKGSQDNGGCVAYKTRKKSLVYAYIRPCYEETKNDSEYTHTVEKGDSLYSIAKKYYGCGNKWHYIYDANNLKSTTIRVGQKLNIPMGV